MPSSTNRLADIIVAGVANQAGRLALAWPPTEYLAALEHQRVVPWPAPVASVFHGTRVRRVSALIVVGPNTGEAAASSEDVRVHEQLAGLISEAVRTSLPTLALGVGALALAVMLGGRARGESVTVLGSCCQRSPWDPSGSEGEVTEFDLIDRSHLSELWWWREYEGPGIHAPVHGSVSYQAAANQISFLGHFLEANLPER
jgi:hypothetical protein